VSRSASSKRSTFIKKNVSQITIVQVDLLTIHELTSKTQPFS
jgi:hypothetical protein